MKRKRKNPGHWEDLLLIHLLSRKREHMWHVKIKSWENYRRSEALTSTFSRQQQAEIQHSSWGKDKKFTSLLCFDIKYGTFYALFTNVMNEEGDIDPYYLQILLNITHTQGFPSRDRFVIAHTHCHLLEYHLVMIHAIFPVHFTAAVTHSVFYLVEMYVSVCVWQGSVFWVRYGSKVRECL